MAKRSRKKRNRPDPGPTPEIIVNHDDVTIDGTKVPRPAIVSRMRWETIWIVAKNRWYWEAPAVGLDFSVTLDMDSITVHRTVVPRKQFMSRSQWLAFWEFVFPQPRIVSWI